MAFEKKRSSLPSEGPAASGQEQGPLQDIDFSSLSIGRTVAKGGFSVVNLARFPAGNADVACKQFNDPKQFEAERNIVMAVRSSQTMLVVAGARQYFVELLGQCSKEATLVYELVPGGDLADFLKLSADTASASVKLRLLL